MNKSSQFFDSTIGRKALVALTGLFLCLFLVVHLAGNLTLLSNDGGLAFNMYSKSMAGNIFIKVIAYVNYIAIIGHAVYALILTIKNNNARPVKYAVNNPSANSLWTSRNMGILGTVILAFIILHMSNFWYKFKFGEIPVVPYTLEDGQTGMIKNYYEAVYNSFKEGWYVAVYVLSMAAIAFHLSHGVKSAFQTLGLSNKKYGPVIKQIGYAFAIAIPAGFAFIPLYFYFCR